MDNKKQFTVIAAICKKNRGIGFEGRLPWKNTTDMKYFQRTTTNCLNETKINAVIMGRNTFESLDKLLPNRMNICITSKPIDISDLHCFFSLDDALYFLNANEKIESIFIIGGETLYKTAINHPDCKEIIINEINNDVICDTFFPEIDTNVFCLKNNVNMAHDIMNLRYIREK